jgi:hypothetical protein
MMTQDPDVQVFLYYAARMMNVNALVAGWEEDFVREIAGLSSDSRRESFRRGFAKSILGQLTPAEFEAATDEDFDTDEELRERLRHLWTKFYGGDDPAASLA